MTWLQLKIAKQIKTIAIANNSKFLKCCATIYKAAAIMTFLIIGIPIVVIVGMAFNIHLMFIKDHRTIEPVA